MSTSLAATNPSQLCFPWMSDSQSERARKDKNHPGKGVKKQVLAPSAPISSERPDLGSAAIVEAQGTKGNSLSSVGLRDGMRVGQVRIGNVMLSLLKKYGITDQEISDVLGAIALENCQKAAS